MKSYTQDNLFWLLLRVSMLTKPTLIQLSEAHKLPPGQMFTLCALEPGKAVPMHAVCGILHCDASNVTGIVDRLVTAGYIERKESDQDRRVKAIRLTEAGEAARSNLLQETAALDLPCAKNLSDEEQKVLKELLAKLLIAPCEQ